MKEKEPVSSNTKQFILRVLAPPSLLSAAAAMPQNLAESVVLLSRAPPPPPSRLRRRLASSRVPAGPGVGPRRVQRAEEAAPAVRAGLDIDVYVIIYGRELARRNAQAVPAHLAVHGMRHREGVSQELVLLGGKCENFVTRHSDR